MSHAFPQTSTQYMRYGYTKVKYRFLKVTLSKYGLILIKIPIDLDILFLIYCICSVHFNLSSIITPKNLVLLTSFNDLI